MFIGREQELQFLEEKYTSPGGQLVVLYGRRRIGKTEALCKFCEGKPHVFYSSREISDNKQLAAFSERVLRAGSPAARYLNTFPDWETAIRGVAELPVGGAKKLLVIDEFPYICKGNPSIPSILQSLWDVTLKSQDIMVILCGSSMSFIEKEILSAENPLYGRATGIYRMIELPFDDAVKFFPNYSAQDRLLAYSILGGIPHYLRQFDPELPLNENIVKNILTKGCVLYSEVEFLARQELREPAMYNTLIEAVALGNTRLNDIYTKTQIEKPKISVYIKNLIELGILEREFSVLSGDKEKVTSTRGLYRIANNFFRFWFRFVTVNHSDLETGDAEGVFEHSVRHNLNDFASKAFEQVCLDLIRKKNRSGELRFRVAKLGRWWGKVPQIVTSEDGKAKQVSVETEIDIVATDSQLKHYILCECKFRNSKSDFTDLVLLKEKSAIASPGTAVQYMLFSKSGFSDALVAEAEKDDNITLYSLSDIVTNGLQ